MKKALAILLIASMSAGMLASCGNTDKPADKPADQPESVADAPADEPTDEPEEPVVAEGDIQVASWNNAADNLKEIADKFNEKENSGKVVINYWDGDYTKLKPALQADSGVPDIFQTQNRDAQAFYNTYGTDKFQDLTDLIEPDKANWPAYVLDMCQYDGKYYSMPWDIGPCGMFYRTDVFEAADVVAEDLTTWDKYMEAGEKLKAVDENYYIADIPFNGTGMDFLMLLLNQQGGQYLKDGKANFNNPEMVNAMNLILEMKEKNLILDTPNAWDDRITGINDNKLVSLCYAAWYMGTMQNSCKETEGKWKIAPAPGFEEGKNKAGIGGSVLSVYSGTKNLELCKDFLVYSMKDNEGNDINMKYGEFPSYSPAYETEFFKAPNPYYSDQATGTTFAALADSPTTEFGPYFTDIATAIQTALGEIVAGGDVAATLDSWTQQAQATLDAK